MSELEKILVELEDDDCTLQESIEKFKKGIELYKYCNNILKAAEGEVKVLLGDEESLAEFNFFKEDEDEYY
ncbi:exodeoxyribonuclease VII small subunit [Tissierellaceae bacterium BX21]|uniref:Exodeoxyribonuclease VII small subunit n=2 Tax=Paratissierella segnis TaxID=2763679 RepID=A0A926IFF3_9FIRM|nr:exodeoxyribonuclease VII small subunit [Paratissierella segnis]